MSLLFAKAKTECNVPLEWIKNKDILSMVKMVRDSDKELMQDAPITSSKVFEKPKDGIKPEEFKPCKRPRKTKM